MNLLKQEAAHVTGTGSSFPLEISSELVKFGCAVDGHQPPSVLSFHFYVNREIENGRRFRCWFFFSHGCPSLKVLSNESMTIIRTSCAELGPVKET